MAKPSPEKMKKWQDMAQHELRAIPLSDHVTQTLEGIDIKPLYTAEDITDIPHLDIYLG